MIRTLGCLPALIRPPFRCSTVPLQARARNGTTTATLRVIYPATNLGPGRATQHPLSFAEFLSAVGEEPALQAARTHTVTLSTAVHEHLVSLLRTYLLLGGMPAVVAEYLHTGSVARASRIQTAITQTFRDDFGKYARASSHHHLDRVVLHAARLVGRKFMYSKVDPDSRSRDLRAAVELLQRAGIVHRVCSTSGAGLPLGAEADDRHYKLIMVDVGLMQSLCGATEQLLDGDPMRINDGAVAEQFVGQELLAHRSPYERPELYYWHRRRKNSTAEVDYLTAAAGRVIPLRSRRARQDACEVWRSSSSAIGRRSQCASTPAAFDVTEASCQSLCTVWDG